jgi:hypothetical protein
MGHRGLIARLVASFVVTMVTAFIVVIALAVADLYLTGHGYSSINREWPGLAMGPADVVLLLAAAAAFLGTWVAMSRKTDA